QQLLALDRVDVEHRCQQDGVGQGLMDIGVELDVDRVGELQAEGVGQGACRQQASPGDGDDDLGVVVGVCDRLRQLTRRLAEQVPCEDLLLIEIARIGVICHECSFCLPRV